MRPVHSKVSTVLFGFMLLSLLFFSGCQGHEQIADAASRDPSAEKKATETLRTVPYLSWSGTNADPQVSGVTLYDEARAWRGYNLYTDDERKVLLLDMHGNEVHSWLLPNHSRCEYARIVEGGDLLAVCVGEGVVRLGWNGERRFDLSAPAHHDVAVRNDGSLVAPFQEGRYPFEGREPVFDGLLFVSPHGDVTGRWSSHEHFETLRAMHGPSGLENNIEETDPDSPDFYHLNSVQVLPATPLGARDSRFAEGNLLLSFRNVSLLVILDKQSGDVVWHWGPGVLDYPHMPRLLTSGTMLVYDNGVKRGWSRVLEIDPESGKTIWSYGEKPAERFFSTERGCVQRLPNGNTLVCESNEGRVLEVTPEGSKVWEFFNPIVKEGRRKRIYRMERLGEQAASPPGGAGAG